MRKSNKIFEINSLNEFGPNNNSNNKNIFALQKSKSGSLWSIKEDDLLMKLVIIDKKGVWNDVSKKISNRTALECSTRYKLIKNGCNKRKWSIDEDNLLANLTKDQGLNFIEISKKIPFRNWRQARDRFNYLFDQKNMKVFTEEEDLLIMRMYMKYGPDWIKIENKIKGKAANVIKYHFYTNLKYKLKNDLVSEEIIKAELEFGELNKIHEGKIHFLIKKRKNKVSNDYYQRKNNNITINKNNNVDINSLEFYDTINIVNNQIYTNQINTENLFNNLQISSKIPEFNVNETLPSFNLMVNKLLNDLVIFNFYNTESNEKNEKDLEKQLNTLNDMITFSTEQLGINNYK